MRSRALSSAEHRAGRERLPLHEVGRGQPLLALELDLGEEERAPLAAADQEPVADGARLARRESGDSRAGRARRAP